MPSRAKKDFPVLMVVLAVFFGAMLFIAGYTCGVTNERKFSQKAASNQIQATQNPMGFAGYNTPVPVSDVPINLKEASINNNVQLNANDYPNSIP